MKDFWHLFRKNIRKISLFLIFMIAITAVVSAQIVDSTKIIGAGGFIGSIFGKAAGETFVTWGLKILGFLFSIDALLALVLTFIPSTTPTAMFVTKVFNWIKFLIGDRKSKEKGGGYWPKA